MSDCDTTLLNAKREALVTSFERGHNDLGHHVTQSVVRHTQAHNLAMKMRVVIPDHVLVGFWCCTWGDLPLILTTKRGHPGSTTRSPHIHNNKAVNIEDHTVRGVSRHSNRHTPGFPEVQCAFKILMIHWILQFALRIAFRCVLHRCESQDIHCWKLYNFFLDDVGTTTTKDACAPPAVCSTFRRL